jgi:hypothetical protein
VTYLIRVAIAVGRPNGCGLSPDARSDGCSSCSICRDRRLHHSLLNVSLTIGHSHKNKRASSSVWVGDRSRVWTTVPAGALYLKKGGSTELWLATPSPWTTITTIAATTTSRRRASPASNMPEHNEELDPALERLPSTKSRKCQQQRTASSNDN